MPLGRAVVVAGAAGSGKSTLAALLVGRLPCAGVVDKDVVTGAVVDAALVAAGIESRDRNGRYYKRNLSQACYLAMEAVAADLAASGVTPVLVAPYEHRVSDRDWHRRLTLRLGVDALIAVWMEASPEALWGRLETRASDRDLAKLKSWPMFRDRVERIGEPMWPHERVDTTYLDQAGLAGVADRLAQRLLRGPVRFPPPAPTVESQHGRLPPRGDHEGAKRWNAH